MKRFKLLSVLLLIALSMGLTSCLNSSSDDSGNTQYGIVEVHDNYGSVYFTTNAGTAIYPSTTSLTTVQTSYGFTATSGLAYIVYTTNSSSSSTSSTSGTTTVTLSYAVSLSNRNNAVQYAKGSSFDTDSTSVTPVLELATLDQSSNSKQMLIYSSSYLLLGVNYYLSATSSNVLTLDNFYMLHYPESSSNTTGNMDIYLRIRPIKGTTISNSYTSSSMTNYLYLYYRAFNISSFLSDFKAVTGKAPTTITLHYYQNSYSGDISSATEKTAKITYSE